MIRLLNSMAHWFAKIPDFSRPNRYFILIVALLGSVGLGLGIRNIEVDQSVDAWLSDDNPAVEALDDFRAQFGSDDGLFLVYRAKDGDVFSPNSLLLLRTLTDQIENWTTLDFDVLGVKAEIWQDLDHILRVQSLANLRYQENTPEAMVSRRLLPKDIEVSKEVAEATRTLALDQDNIALQMFSENQEFGALVITTDFGAEPVLDIAQGEIDLGAEDELELAFDDFELEVDGTAMAQDVEFIEVQPQTYLAFITALKAIYNQEQFSEQFEFYPIGMAGMMESSMDIMIQSGVLLGIGVVLLVILLWTLFQTAAAVILPVLCIVASMVWVVGGMTWLGIPTSQLLALSAMLVLAVGVADCVHVMSEYLYYRRAEFTHEDAMRKSYEKTGVPILLTTLTTMAGMGAIAFGGIGQFVVFGISSAAGVFSAFVFTLFVLPSLLELWHPNPNKGTAIPISMAGKIWHILTLPVRLLFAVFGKIGLSWLFTAAWLPPLLARIPQFSFRFRGLIIIVFSLIFGICLYGASKVKIDSNLVDLFREGTPLRVTYEIVDTHMAGTSSMEIMMDFQEEDALSDPKVLQTIDQLQDEIESKYSHLVTRTNSIADLVKSMHKTIQDGNQNFYTIPDDQQAVSQLLYLFNSSAPEDRQALVSDDYSRSHISIQMRNAGSVEYAELLERMQQDIDAAFSQLSTKYEGQKITVTGSVALLMQLADVISNLQVKSLTIAVVIISAFLMLALGSFYGGLIAIIPNMLPSVFAFGLMGLFGIPLDTDTLMIAPLIIGIAVDDTIHFVTHYRMALAKHGDLVRAIKEAVLQVGQAVTFTTLVLGICFFMLTFSDYLGLAKVGFFGALAIFVALLCDLLFLPALIYVFKPKFGVKDVMTDTATVTGASS